MLLLTPEIFTDQRGFFTESWNLSVWKEILSNENQIFKPFVQDNHSRSIKGVVRGLHWQCAPAAQAKLVRCVVGEIYDVVVDLRRSSQSFASWIAVSLDANQQSQLWVPEGFAHGFMVISEVAEVVYKTTDYWSPECERSLRWNDPDVAIQWPDFESTLLSSKDQEALCLADHLVTNELFP